MFLDGKKGLGKRKKKGEIVTRFWYTLKNLHPVEFNINRMTYLPFHLLGF